MKRFTTTILAILTVAVLLLTACNNYSVVILGDTHYDTYPLDTYHAQYYEPVEWLNNVQRDEFERNAQMWQDRCNRLLLRASELVTSDTRMIVQVGDLIQGDCGTAEVHRQMLSDVMHLFESRFPSDIPFITVAGNHDVRGNYDVDGSYNRWGNGAEKVYDDFMPPRMSEELGKSVNGTTFSFWVGKDLYIVIDFNSPDDAAIELALKEASHSRNTFIICHAPVFPYNDGSVRWIFHGGDTPSENEARRHFRKVFAESDAIVLCGHTHNTEFLDWKGDGGHITQMTMNSVWANDELGTYFERDSTVSQYGSVGKEDELFAEYITGLAAYSLSPAAGSYKMNVRGRHVTVDFYAGDSREVSKRFILR